MTCSLSQADSVEDGEPADPPPGPAGTVPGPVHGGAAKGRPVRVPQAQRLDDAAESEVQM